MRSEFKFFGIITAFLFVACGVYWWWTGHEFSGLPAGEPHGPDYVGTVALALSGLLCAMCGGYFWFVSRRIDPRPEDRAAADIAEGAGDVGFFSPGSYWPFGVALASVVAGLGLVYKQWWLVGAGIIAVLLGAGGLLFEYYTGARRSH